MGQVNSQLEDLDDLDRQAVLNYDLTIKGVCNKIKTGGVKNIVVIVGAGISTSAGIPDFRSPNSGIYNNLEEYNLPTPESLFDIDYFNENPESFYNFAKNLLPGNYYPTLSHYFLKLLAEHNILQKVYTQNIDMLERLAGIPSELLCECHGNFSTAYCSVCHKPCDSSIVEEGIMSNTVLKCFDKECNGYLKPGIVFYGEPLMKNFQLISANDLMAADLLIVMGTSLAVDPCANMPYQVDVYCPRLLLNNEVVGPFVNYKSSSNYRDVVSLGNLDDLVYIFAKEMGWDRELYRLQRNSYNKLDKLYHPDRLFNPLNTIISMIKSFSPFTPRVDDDDEYSVNSVNSKDTDEEIDDYSPNSMPYIIPAFF